MLTPGSFLYLDALHCVHQHDHVLDADSPYLLLFVGQRDTEAQADVVRITSPRWHERTRSGQMHLSHAWVHHDLRADSVALAALLEQNWQLDVHDLALEKLRHAMQQRWACFVRRLSAASLPLAATHAFTRQLQLHLQNDALIQLRPLSVTTQHGALPALQFSGRRARYRAHFRTRRLVGLKA